MGGFSAQPRPTNSAQPKLNWWFQPKGPPPSAAAPLLGKLVVISGLEKRADLNGTRARAVTRKGL